jgi:hypothetical protein
LHVLGTPPAFILSQDQTLHRNCRGPCTTRNLDDRSGSSPLPTTLRLSTCPAHGTHADEPSGPSGCASSDPEFYSSGIGTSRAEATGQGAGPGGGLLSHAVARAVSSALGRFTTVFGKGTGGSAPRWSPGPGPGPVRGGEEQRGDPVGPTSCMGSMMSRSAISTARLSPLPGVHRPPINQVVCLGPYPVDLGGPSSPGELPA